MQVVGLTGGIATGKSTVGHILTQALGVPVVDADRVARQVLEPGSPVLAQVIQAFGPQVCLPDGSLNRSWLRAHIAHHQAARQTLNQLTHPPIRAAIAHQLAKLADAGHLVAVVEAALLVETGSYRDYPWLIVVSCPPDVQLARLVQRDRQSASSARALIAAQLPMAQKEAVATVVIQNTGDLPELRKKTLWAWMQLMRLADPTLDASERLLQRGS